MPRPLSDARDARPPSSSTTTAAATAGWTRAAVVLTAAIALLLGVTPGLGVPAADAVTANTGNFRTTVTVDQENSDLRPGGHVRYALTSTNTQAAGDSAAPNYTALLLYGVSPSAELTYRSAGGQLYHPRNWGQGGTFVGGPSGFIATNDGIPDILSNIHALDRTFVRGQASRSGWISFDIPANAHGGTTYRAGMNLIEAPIRSRFEEPIPNKFVLPPIVVVTLGPVGTQTQLTAPGEAARVGQSVDLSATVSGVAGTNTPTGSVTFTADGQRQTASIIDGVATTAMTFGTAGATPVTATFNPGNGNQWQASTAAGTVQVGTGADIPTQLVLELRQDIAVDQPTALIARVAPADADGTVTFGVGDQHYVVNVVEGVAATEHTFTDFGEYEVTAVFVPADADRHSPSRAETTVVLQPLTGSPNPGSPASPGWSHEWFATVGLGSLSVLTGSTTEVTG